MYSKPKQCHFRDTVYIPVFLHAATANFLRQSGPSSALRLMWKSHSRPISRGGLQCFSSHKTLMCAQLHFDYAVHDFQKIF